MKSALHRPLVPWLTLWVMVSTGLAATPLRVVTSVAPLTDIVRSVGGPAIQLHGVVPDGINSHTFQPTPGDVKHLAEADLVILNGLDLELPIEKLTRSSGKPDVAILKLGDAAVSRAAWLFDGSFPKAEGHPNPHLWLNVAHTMSYVTLIRDSLMTLDPDHRSVYQQNAATYLARLNQLDRCITDAVSTIPSGHRKLLTYHDSWPYFARRYGFTVLGAVQPANFFEPSPREIARLIDQLREAKIPAIFGSEVFPSKVLEKIAAETGVRYVNALRDDVLPGKPGDRIHSYIGMMIANVNIMVEALGGKPSVLRSCGPTLPREIQ